MDDRSAIADWYGCQSVLVTGATGFMGKVMVEKILRSCPNIDHIYIIIRNKKGRDPSQRLEDFIKNPVFDNLRKNKSIFQKIKCFNGDITLPSCGLSNEHRAVLQENVTTVFHMAANVRFDQPLKSALLLNTGGTLNMLELASTFRKLKVFVHVSTSYCQCSETVLEERLYKAPHDPRKILELVKWMDSDLVECITPKLLRNFPNTYAYTKCLTEQLVSEYCDKLPIAIGRPSIVLASLKEPIPGWVDNMNGPTGILIAAGKGVIRSMHCNPDFAADVVPVDCCVNSLLIVGWRKGNSSRRNEIDVYNITANKKQCLTWGEAVELGRKHFYKYPFSVCLWYPGGSIKSTYFVHSVSVFFFHLIPAYLVDFLMILTKNKPFLVRLQQRIQNGLGVLQYYTTRNWYFKNEKLVALYDSLNNVDQDIFFTNKRLFDTDEYMENYIMGARKYCAHEEPETLPHARKNLRRLYYLDVLKNVILIGLLLYFFYIYATSFLEKIENSFIFFNTTRFSLSRCVISNPYDK